MSTATLEAGAATAGEATTSTTDAGTGLLGGIGAAAATTAITEATQGQAATEAQSLPDDVPYIFKLINSNPDLKPFEKQLASKFDKATTPDEFSAEVAKSYANLEKFKGRPGADADPATVTQWRKLNGVPDTPEGYGLLSNETLKAMGVDEAMASEYAADFHAANVSAEDAAKIIEGHKVKLDRAMEAQKTAQAAEYNTKVDALRKEHGQQFDSVMRDATTVHRLAMATAGVSEEKAAQFANDPDHVRVMIALSKRMQSTPMVKGGMDSIIAGDSAKWKGMLADPKSPINDPYHPDHQRTVDEYAHHVSSFG